MAKLSGIPLVVEVDTSGDVLTDISNDLNSVSVNTSKGEQDITGLDVSAVERLMLLLDAELALTGTFNEALSHRVFRDCGCGTNDARDVQVTFPGGGALDVLTMKMVFSGYTVSRGTDGSLTYTTSGKLADGIAPAYA